MKTTRLTNGLNVLAHENGHLRRRSGSSRDARTFANNLQAVNNKDRLRADGWEARVWQSPLSRVRYVVVEGRRS